MRLDAEALIAEMSNPKYPYTYDAEHVFKRMIDAGIIWMSGDLE